MTDRRPDPSEVARYLRQQGDLAGGEVFLSRLSGKEALELALEARRLSEMRSREWEPTPEAAEGPVLPDPEKAEAAFPDREALPADYEGLRQQALTCQRCELARARTNVVFSDGNPDARLMVVGEAPGAKEDETGLAFVGPAGQYLDLLLATIDLSRDRSVYICNVLKCRPPGNRNPLPEEIRECTPYLRRQIELIDPDAILGVGAFAAQFLTGRETALGRLRGEVYAYQGVPVVVTYHPAALLRNRGWTRATWDDLQLLRQVMA